MDKLCWHPHGRSIQSTLGDAGYKTGGFGKMHFNPVRDSHGFQFFALHEELQCNGREFREDDDYFMYLKKHGYGHVRYPCGVRGLLYTQPQISPIPEEHHETKWVADRAIEFIETFHNVPFLCYASWMQPHWPVHVPATWANMYDSNEMPLPVYTEEEQASLPYFARLMKRSADMGEDVPAIKRIKRVKALYYASISYIDHQVGRILNTLEKHGILENTLIIFTADHGEMLFDHLAIGKCLPYDSCIRIPFIVACPEMKNVGTPSEEFVTLHDIAPTIYEYTGVAPPENNKLAGHSLLGQRKKISEREEIYTEIHKSFVCIRTKKWKYAFHHYGGLRQLFDMQNDPHELHNLLLNSSKEYQIIAQNLHSRLLEWAINHSVKERISEEDFVTYPEPPLWPDRNSQIEDFVNNLPEEEKNRLWSEARSVYEAIKNEKELDISQLDLQYWESKRGHGCIKELESLMGKRLRH